MKDSCKLGGCSSIGCEGGHYCFNADGTPKRMTEDQKRKLDAALDRVCAEQDIPPIFYNGDTKRDPAFRERANKFYLSREFLDRLKDVEEPGGLMACSPEIYSQMMKELPMTTMRAKLQVGMVQEHMGWVEPGSGKAPEKSSETLIMHAVCKPTYADSEFDEDNTYAKMSPGANLTIHIANPALWGKFKHGDKFYVDFTPAE
jgi:hypothetical protein